MILTHASKNIKNKKLTNQFKNDIGLKFAHTHKIKLYRGFDYKLTR